MKYFPKITVFGDNIFDCITDRKSENIALQNIKEYQHLK